MSSMDIIARSRIGYWTAFRQEGVSYLNIRASDTSCATIVLNARDVDLLSASADVCHPHARHLAEHGVLATGLYRLRFVTHLDVDAPGIDRAVAVIRQFFKA